MGVSCCCLSQRYRALSMAARPQTCYLLCFRRCSRKERDALLDELSGVYPRKFLPRLRRTCSPYTKLVGRQARGMFYKNFEYRLLP